MSTWSVPVTWVNGGVTAASMNTLRDNLLFVKGALDLLTGSTTADTGTTMQLKVIRAASSDDALDVRISGDTDRRLLIEASGTISWGNGSGTNDLQMGRSASAAGRLLVTGTDPQIVLDHDTGGDQNTIASLISGDTQPRIALGTTSSNQPRIAWGSGSSAPDFFLTRDAAGRIVASATSDHGRIGALLIDTASEANSHFAWASGDTIPRIAIGATSSGNPAVRFSPGSGATYEELYRSSTAGLSLTASLTAIRTASSLMYFAGQVAGDTGPRFRVSTTAGGYGAMYFDDGSSAAGSEKINLYANADDDLRTDDHFYAAELAVPVKAGVPSDSDTTIDMSGNCILDTSSGTGRIYFRVGSTWRYAALT